MNDMDRWWNLNNVYGYRNDNLRALGFKSYASYLRSALWKGIRARVLERDQRTCRRCFQPAYQVHHRAYDPATLRGDCIDALSAVCRRCHKKAEFKLPKPGTKNFGQERYQRLQRANAELLKRRKARHTRTKLPRPRLVKREGELLRIEPEHRPLWG